jgi:hypothetical protein
MSLTSLCSFTNSAILLGRARLVGIASVECLFDLIGTIKNQVVEDHIPNIVGCGLIAQELNGVVERVGVRGGLGEDWRGWKVTVLFAQSMVGLFLRSQLCPSTICVSPSSLVQRRLTGVLCPPVCSSSISQALVMTELEVLSNNQRCIGVTSERQRPNQDA